MMTCSFSSKDCLGELRHFLDRKWLEHEFRHSGLAAGGDLLVISDSTTNHDCSLRVFGEDPQGDGDSVDARKDDVEEYKSGTE